MLRTTNLIKRASISVLIVQICLDYSYPTGFHTYAKPTAFPLQNSQCFFSSFLSFLYFLSFFSTACLPSPVLRHTGLQAAPRMCSEPLHLQFPLPVILYPPNIRMCTLSLHLSVCSNITFSNRPFLTTPQLPILLHFLICFFAVVVALITASHYIHRSASPN